jgi:DNA gyrase subunit B
MSNEEYSAKNIKILEGLEAVRKRPGMYIGGTGSSGLHHLIKEVVDNSIDEALAGYCTKVDISLNKDNSITVIDNGRGIPVDEHSTGKSAAEIIFTVLHAGGKFDKGSYKVSGGLHGVGASVVNALSKWVKIEIYKNGFEYHLNFENQKKVGELKKIGATTKVGTKVSFLFDDTIFKNIKYDFEIMKKRYKETAYLTPTITINLENQKSNEKLVYHFKGGIKDYVDDITKNSKRVLKDTIYINGDKEDVECSCAFTYIDSYSEKLDGFVNNVTTPGGGTHLSGFKLAITKAMKDYISKNGKKDVLKMKFSGDDIREGIVCIVSVKVPEPQFEGQTKDKLGNPEVQQIVNSIVFQKIYDYLDANPKAANQIINKVALAFKAREAAKRAKDLIRRKSGLEFSSLPGKLSDCANKDPSKCELFIVEGDSAGGTAKQGRLRDIQAILPLKGKPLNVEKARLVKILENNEIATIISALGCGFKENINYDKLRYHKIIIMADADVDGQHIETLLLTLFFRYFKDLILRGHIYMAMPPLYKIGKGKSSKYIYTQDEMNEFLNTEEGKKKLTIQRYKGLGEMNADQLWETTLDPESRYLKKIGIVDAKEAEETFEMLMGDKVAPRKEFIIKNSKFVKDLDI